MEKSDFDGERRIGSVRAAVNMYGKSILRASSAPKKPLMDLQESSSSVAKELHKSRREINLYEESRREAESAKAAAESELSNAKKKVKELTLLIEKSSSKAKVKKRAIETLRESRTREEMVSTAITNESSEYAEVMKELEIVKQELSKLKLDIALVLEDKSRAEKEIEISGLKMELNLRSVEGLRKEIEMVNEEQVLVELARIEAMKEFGEIEDQREKISNEFSFLLEERKKKIKEMVEEIKKSREIENELSVTLSDVNMLETQLNLVREMEKKVQRSDSLPRRDDNFQKEEDSLLVLKAITEEIEEKKKEMSSIKDEGFHFMTYMDAARRELNRINNEMACLNKIKGKVDSKIRSLHSKLLRAKSKLETVSAAEEKSKSVATKLSVTLEQLKTDTEAAKKEKLLIDEETNVIKAEREKIEFEIDEKEEKWQTKLRELEEVRVSEALALEKLECLIENTMPARACVSQHSSTISISRFEYEYLTGHAFQAKDIANKKVVAAQAWVEALKASEKEILMQTEMLKREGRKPRVEEKRELYKTERSFSVKKMVEKEIQECKQQNEKDRERESFSSKLARKSTRGSGIGKLTPIQQTKFRKRFSPAIRGTPTYFVIKKKRKVPNLIKFFSGRR